MTSNVASTGAANYQSIEHMEEGIHDFSCPDVQVLTLGLPRCATRSLAAALISDVLQYRPVLCASVAKQNDWDGDIIKALSKSGDKNKQKRYERLQKVLEPNVACAETLNVLADDLMDLCPNAKLILNVRPPAMDGEDPGVDWARSCRETIIFFATLKYFVFCAAIPPMAIWYSRYRTSTKLWRQKGLLPPSQPKRTEQKGRAWMTADFYHNYLAWVQEEAAKRNREVLLWHAREGWVPICEFLGKPVPPPHIPFPHLNDKEMWMRDRKRFIRAAQWSAAWSFFVMLILAIIRGALTERVS